jgi:hypothetical protein
MVDRPDAMKDWIGTYILEGHRPVAERDTIAWAQWLEAADRIVARTEHELFVVSTVFLGLDYRHCGNGPPLLFESMVFFDGVAQHFRRYSSWDDAETGHKAMVRQQMEKVRASAKAT